MKTLLVYVCFKRNLNEFLIKQILTVLHEPQKNVAARARLRLCKNVENEQMNEKKKTGFCDNSHVVGILIKVWHMRNSQNPTKTKSNVLFDTCVNGIEPDSTCKKKH